MIFTIDFRDSAGLPVRWVRIGEEDLIKALGELGGVQSVCTPWPDDTKLAALELLKGEGNGKTRNSNRV